MQFRIEMHMFAEKRGIDLRQRRRPVFPLPYYQGRWRCRDVTPEVRWHALVFQQRFRMNGGATAGQRLELAQAGGIGRCSGAQDRSRFAG